MSVLMLSATLFFFGCAQKIDPEKVKANTKQLEEKFAAAFAKEDLNGVLECYWNSPEVIIYPPDAPGGTGYDAVKAEFEKFFAENEVKGLEFSNNTYLALGDYVFSSGNFTVTLGAPDGQQKKMEGRFTQVSALKDGKWVYISDHASVPLPPPPTPEQMKAMMEEMMKKPMKK